MKMNNIHVIHMLIWFIYKNKLESGRLVSDMSKVWEDTGGCVNQYRYAFSIYLMNLFSSSYDITMYLAINDGV